jgi:hypothetical protein
MSELLFVSEAFGVVVSDFNTINPFGVFWSIVALHLGLFSFPYMGYLSFF